MPLYEYECESCSKRFEVLQKLSDPDVAACTACGKGPVHRQLSSPAIQFKGSGWYVTDYAKKSATDAGKTDTGTATGAAEKSGKTDAASGTSTGTSAPTPPAATGTDKK